MGKKVHIWVVMSVVGRKKIPGETPLAIITIVIIIGKLLAIY